MKKKSIKPILLKLPYLAFVYLFDKLTEAMDYGFQPIAWCIPKKDCSPYGSRFRE